MPVILAVRMSLSFPLLFSTVPLYAHDHSLRDLTEECIREQKTLQKNLFSDGGISSNFPVHFFDHLVPARPTFGINLSEHAPCRHGDDPPQAPFWNRIYMPYKAQQGLTIPMHKVTGLLGFLFAILNSAKDWQDALRSIMPGFRERIVNVALKSNEGGINIHMPKATIDHLIALGDLAGIRVLQGEGDTPPFSFDAHRWRRLLSTMEALETELPIAVQALLDEQPTGDPGSGSLMKLIEKMEGDSAFREQKFKEISYRGSGEDLRSLRLRLEALAQLVRTWQQHPRRPGWDMPSPSPRLSVESSTVGGDKPLNTSA